MSTRIASLALGAALTVAASATRPHSPRAANPASQALADTGRVQPVLRPQADRTTGTDLITAFLGAPLDKQSDVQLEVLIVSLPDPISSHLDWSYDAQLESVRRAFERDGYLIDRFWLPWRQYVDSASVNVTTADALPGSRAPGVILFRRSALGAPVLRLVYVVGEVPTLGVQKQALRQALSERSELLARLGRPDTLLRIVGPAFSGSARSLRQVIDEWRSGAGRMVVVRVITGSASDASNLAMLSGPQMRFASTVHTSSSLTEAAQSLLVDRLQMRPREIAFLTEGTTQYGQGAQDSTTGMDAPLSISFPLSISSLRAQYARHPEVVISNPDAPVARVQPRIPLDTREPTSLTESPRVLSQLTPPAAEIMFRQLERTLLSHRIRAVAILATDIRDQLFLASELRKRLPDLQLVFYGSNALFLRSEYAEALTGSIVISTYPLFTENQYWDLTKRDNQRFAFMSDESEGVFNATLAQLGAASEMTEYVPPITQGHAHRPPVWYTVIGRDGIYPLALAATPGPSAALDHEYMLLRPAESRRNYTEAFPWENQFLLALVALCTAFLFCFALLQRRTASRVDAALVSPLGASVFRDVSTAGTRDGADLRVAESTSLLLHRELYVLLRYIALFGAFSAALLMMQRPHAHGIVSPSWALVPIALLAAVISVIVGQRVIVQTIQVHRMGRLNDLGFFSGGRAPRRNTWLWNIEKVARLAMLLLGALYLVLLLSFVSEALSLEPRAATFFFYRAVAFTGGVSAALPIIIASLGFATWCSWHLVRIALLSEPTVYEHFLLHNAAEEVWLTEARLRVHAIERDIKHAYQVAVSRAARAVNGMRPALRADGGASTAAAFRTRELMVFAEASAYQVDQLALDAERTISRALGVEKSPTPEQQTIIAFQTRETTRVRDRCHDAMKRARARWAETTAEHETMALGRAVTGEMAARSRGTAHERRSKPRRPPVRGWARRLRALENWYDDRRRDEWLDRRSMTAAQSVRDSLVYMIPSFGALALLATIGAAGLWLSGQFELTFESLALSTHAWLFGMSSFDALLRFGVISSIGATTWAIYRFIVVWGGIRTVLDDVDPVLLPALVNLPARLARITRLTPFGETSRYEIEAEVDKQWHLLHVMEADAQLLLPASIAAPPMPRSRPFEIDGDAHRRFSALHDKLQECKAKALLAETYASSSTAPTTADERWARQVAELYAVYVADYIDWVFQHLRYLATFLMIAMVLTSVMLSSYTFHPLTVFRVISLALLGGAVVVIVSAIIQINRHHVLSAITNTTGGKLSLDSHLVSNLVTYGLVPLITVASTQLPQVREFLFSWVTPLLHAFVKN